MEENPYEEGVGIRYNEAGIGSDAKPVVDQETTGGNGMGCPGTQQEARKHAT